MKAILLLLIGLAVRIAFAGPEASGLKQQEQSFTIRLNASVADVTPLFGPVREAEWAPGWAPEFVYPHGGGQIEGAVFITKTANDRQRIWVLSTYDEKQGRIEYVVVAPGSTANEIKIRVVPDGADQSRATIIYRHTALTPEGNHEVEQLDQAWGEQQRSHWETAINEALGRRRKK